MKQLELWQANELPSLTGNSWLQRTCHCCCCSHANTQGKCTPHVGHTCCCVEHEQVSNAGADNGCANTEDHLQEQKQQQHMMSVSAGVRG